MYHRLLQRVSTGERLIRDMSDMASSCHKFRNDLQEELAFG